jgi:hypothetical protein
MAAEVTDKDRRRTPTSHIAGGCVYSTALHFWPVEKLTGWHAMTIYRTRYRDPKEHRWVSA